MNRANHLTFWSKAIFGVAIVAVCSIFGCAAGKPIVIKEMPQADGGIRFRIKADSNINLTAGRPTSLVLCVYQLSDEKVFLQMSQELDSVLTLLACRSFSDDVVTFRKVVVYPSEIRSVTMDREKYTRHVGVVAGYYESTPSKMVRLYSIPTHIKEEGFFVKTRTEIPGMLDKEIVLEPKGIRGVDKTSLEDHKRNIKETDESSDKPTVASGSEKPLWRKWWPWTIGGAVLLGGAIGTNVYSHTVDSSEKDTAMAWYGVAVAGYVLAAGAATAGIVLDLTYEEPAADKQSAPDTKKQALIPILTPNTVGVGFVGTF